MPLIKYATYVYLPGGNPAANMDIPIQLVGGNQLVPLFADKAATTPLPNPVTTDAEGFLWFYAAPGAFCLELSGEMFHVLVAEDETDEAWPGLFIHDQPVAASTWKINHHFGVQPAVTVLVAGQRAEVDVTHPDDTTAVLTFGAPTVGVAYLRR